MNKNEKGFSAIEVLIAIIVIVLIGSAGWYVWQNKKQANNNASAVTGTSQKAPLKAENTQQSKKESQKAIDATANWKTYEGRYFTFKYPGEWKPSVSSGFEGVGRESVSLGMPSGVFDGQQTIGFTKPSYGEAIKYKPQGLIKETGLNIGGRSGIKWVSRDEVGVSYYYKSPEATSGEHFEVSVGGPNGKQINDLESVLDLLASTVKFKS